MNVIIRIFLAFFLMVVIVTLSACDNLSGIPTVAITAHFEPTTLGFEVDDNGAITVAAHAITFVNRPGAIGAIIRGYDVEYLDPAGNPILPGDSILRSSGSLGVTIPPGFICVDQDNAVIETNCDINIGSRIAGARYVTQSSESLPASNFITLPGPVAIEVLRQNYTGARALFHFNATTDLNEDITIDIAPVAIVFPVAAIR